MSRHRLFRNLDVAKELDVDTLEDDGDDGVTPEQHSQLEAGLERIRGLIGSEALSGLSDATIKDALWEFYFDVEMTTQWLIDEQERRKVARERKGKMLPPLPVVGDDSDSYDESYGSLLSPISLSQSHHDQLDQGEADGRSRVPLIVLAQQQQQQQQLQQYQQYHPEFDDAFSETSSIPHVRPALSTITERTERTEASSHWPSKHQLVAMNNPRPMSSPSTSYGELIEDNFSDDMPVNPNKIPVSPSGSALQRLSHYEPAPSMLTSDSETTSSSTPTPRQSTIGLPPMETIPDIPDFKSSPTMKKSKLSMLATSRSSASSLSTRTATLGSSSSVKTYPALRPSSMSEQTLMSAALPSARAPSSTSSHVRRAIQVALNQEAGDQDKSTQSSVSVSPSKRTKTSTNAGTQSPQPASPVPDVERPSTSETQTSSRPLSKLALMAQAKAQSNAGSRMGKLAITTKQLPVSAPRLPEPHTEYLTPIANGPTATTAITTTYQSLYSLTSPSFQPATPHVVPMPMSVSETSSPVIEPKHSKLASKIKKAQVRAEMQQAEEEYANSVTVSPLFAPKPTRTRALPSAFASLLIDDSFVASLEDKEKKQDASPTKAKNDARRERKKERSSRKHTKALPPPPPSDVSLSERFAFDVPSPDDVVFNARKGTALAKGRDEKTTTPTLSSVSSPAKEREKAQRIANTPASSRAVSPSRTPGKGRKAGISTPKKSGTSTPARVVEVDHRNIDIAALNLHDKEDEISRVNQEAPKMSFASDKLLDEARKAQNAPGGSERKGVSLVVIGHVDAGKSTLMGRLLYELGRVDERTRIANERESNKVGKSSFSWAWELDGTAEERERGITMDIGVQSLATPHRQITILDAPGHKDFIPNMISGASQADCALLVVDASTGEFEAGFERGGQTREHLLLVRSLGVSQVIVAVNKLDQVQWEKDRYDDICGLLQPFLVQSGFHPSKTKFVPVGALLGINLLTCKGPDAVALSQWYSGPTLVDLLDELQPPTRDLSAHFRFPISNVFKGQGSGTAVSGRICGGVVQIGERLRILPGDESATVKLIQVEDVDVPWAAAGSNVTMYLTAVDPVHLNIGSVLCRSGNLVPLASTFTARVIVFDIQPPITAGTSVEIFQHSRDVPATISKLLATIDRASGSVIKKNPRVLSKGQSAEVEISLRGLGLSGPSSTVRPIPLEPFSANKDMGRILIRRGGDTISAGIILKVIS